LRETATGGDFAKEERLEKLDRMDNFGKYHAGGIPLIPNWDHSWAKGTADVLLPKETP